MATTPAAPLNTFIIYARDDRPYKDQLLRHLRPLTRNGLLRVWHDGDIQPGEDWHERIKTELAASELVLVLVSVHSLNSDFIENEELAIAVRQLRAGQARIVPILVGPCLWKYHPLLAGLQGLPTDLKPVEEWGNQNSAWTDVATALAEWAEAQAVVEEPVVPPVAKRTPPAAAVKNTPPVPAPKPQLIVPEGFVLVKGGTFKMGDLFGDGFEKDREMPHTVTVSDFCLAKYALTFDEYDAFCEATKRNKPSDSGWGRGQRPVINVSWYDAVEYCNWRSKRERRTLAYAIQSQQVSLNAGATGYRLPTEAEWEYAARVGDQKIRFGNGRDLIYPSDINFDASFHYREMYSIVGEYRRKTVHVGELSANALGLYQMSGNVLEWCWDWYSEKFYSESNGARNPLGPREGTTRVVRGGSWRCYPEYCRAARRSLCTPTFREFNVGFRLASSL